MVSTQLFEAQRTFCDQMLTPEDLKEAIFCMADDKALGCDNFPCEFYKALWPCVGPDLLKVYQKAYHSCSLGKIINKGNIKFILKVRYSEDICNWRSITLLNVSNKISAKALALKN